LLAIDGDGHSATSTNETYSRLQCLRCNGYSGISTAIYFLWGFAFFLRIVHQQHVGDVNDVGLHASSRISCTFDSTSCMTANTCRGLEDMHGFHDISSLR